MTSERQMEANRRNALLSTGPRTDAGKAIVARNAMVHGLRARQVLIEGESEEAFCAFRDAMAEYYEPVGVLEGELVEKIVVALWRLKRTARIEVEILEHFSQPEDDGPGAVPFTMIIRKTYTGSPVEIDEPAERAEPRAEPVRAKRKSLGEAVKAALEGAGVLSKFMRYEAHIAKMLFVNMRELERVQERRKREQQQLAVSVKPLETTDYTDFTEGTEKGSSIVVEEVTEQLARKPLAVSDKLLAQESATSKLPNHEGREANKDFRNADYADYTDSINRDGGGSRLAGE